MSTKIHPTALVDRGAFIDHGVEIGPFTIIGSEAQIDADVSIGSHCVIDRVWVETDCVIRSFVELRADTRIGPDCYIDSGVKSSGENTISARTTVRYDAILARGVLIGEDSFIAPQVMTINVDAEGNEIGGAHIGRRCHVGTAATLQPGLVIGDDVIVGAKALVTRDLPLAGTYIGIPARPIDKGVGI